MAPGELLKDGRQTFRVPLSPAAVSLSMPSSSLPQGVHVPCGRAVGRCTNREIAGGMAPLWQWDLPDAKSPPQAECSMSQLEVYCGKPFMADSRLLRKIALEHLVGADKVWHGVGIAL